MAHWLGIDLGATNTKVAVVSDEDWTIRHQGQAPTDRRSPQHTVRACAELARRWVDDIGDVAGVGCTLPGVFDADGMPLVVANLPGDWRGVGVREPLSEATGLPTTLINDARAFGLAESRLGAARGLDDVIGMTLGTGIGGAVVLGGELYVGRAGNAGELGHQVLLPDGPPCGCGNRGCLEAHASGPAITAMGVRAVVQGVTTSIGALAGHDLNRITPEVIRRAAEEGDAVAAEILERAGTALGVGISNLITLLSPDRVVLGGSVARLGEWLLRPVRAEVQRRCHVTPLERVQIVTAALEDPGIVGAAVWASQQRRAER